MTYAVDTIEEVNALSHLDHPTVFVKSTDGGMLYWAPNLSTHLLGSVSYVASGIDTTTDTITFPFSPNAIPGVIGTSASVPCKGFAFYCSNANSNPDFVTGQIYWVWRDVTNYTSIKLCPTFEDAMAGTGFINLTNTALPTFRLHRDPTQGMIRIPTGEALDGSEGGFRRISLSGEVYPEFFGAVSSNEDSAVDSGKAIQMALFWARSSVGKSYASSVSGRMNLYKSTISLNLTGLQNAFAVLKDIRILSACHDKICLDMSGCNSTLLSNVTIVSDNSGLVVPSYHLVLTRANNGSHTSPIPAAASNTLQNVFCYGDASKASFLNLNSDLSRLYGCKFYNTYRGTDKKTTAVLHAAAYETVDRYLGGVTSEYQEIIDAADVFPTNTGTTLDHIYDIEARRPADYALTVDHVTKNGSTLVLHFSVDDDSNFLSDKEIADDDPVNLLPNVDFGVNFPRGNYTLKNINYANDTAEVWIESGASAFDATSVDIGKFASLRMTNMTGPAIIIGGGSRGVSMRGYSLAYSATNVILDLAAGDINRLVTEMVHENGQNQTFYLVPGDEETREITEWTQRGMGDLSGPSGNIRKKAGHTIKLKDFVYRDAYKQPGTAAMTTARLFSGSTDQLILENVDIASSSSFLINDFRGAAFAGRPSGKVYDAETGAITYYPQGTYAPTYRATTNVNTDSVSTLAGAAIRFHQHGNIVKVRGTVSIDPVAANTITTFSMTLPVASNLTAASDLTGLGIRINSTGEMATISADTTNDVAVFTLMSTVNTSFNLTFEFEYIVK